MIFDDFAGWDITHIFIISAKILAIKETVLQSTAQSHRWANKK